MRFFPPSLTPSRSHLLILGDLPTWDIKHTQEMSPELEREGLFHSHPYNHCALSRPHHALACAGPSVSGRCSGRTSEILCSIVLPTHKVLTESLWSLSALQTAPQAMAASGQLFPMQGNSATIPTKDPASANHAMKE